MSSNTISSRKGQDYTSKDYKYISEFLSQFGIPDNQILFIHARLKGLKKESVLDDLDYETLTKLLLDCFMDSFDPKAILVPTFTYSFTDSGVYHRNFSKSEVGRFSEETRLKFSEFRTPDPIFSVADITGFLKGKEIDYTTAFGEGGLFELLHEENCAIINLDLPKLLMTQVHYIEKECDVSYRYDKMFDGVVYDDDQNWRKTEYEYFVRDLDDDPQMDYQKREEFLSNRGSLETVKNDDITGSWISAQEKYDLLSKKLVGNERFLLEE